MMKFPVYLTLLLVSCLAGINSCTAGTIFLNDPSVLTQIGKSVSLLEDKSGIMTLEEVLSKKNELQFRESNQEIPNMGVTSSAFWARFDLENKSNEEIYLEIANCNLEQVDFYKMNNGIAASFIHTGSLQNFNQRQIKNTFYHFLLLKPDERMKTTFYLRFFYQRGLLFPLKIGTLKVMMETSHKKDFFQGIYFGIMIIMLLYNLTLYFRIKDRSYLYYVFYVFSMGLLNAIITGYAFEYLWPQTPILNKYGDAAACLAGISGILFATNFLNTAKFTPLLHKLFKIIFAVYALILPMIFFGSILLSNIAMEIISLALILLFFNTAVVIIRKGYKPARLFLFAWSMLLISVIIFIFKDYNLIPNTIISEYSMQFGSAAEAALLSLAVANRINIYKKEKEEAQEKHLQSLETNKLLITQQNTILEQKVESRTRELKETQLNLMRQEKLASLGQLTAGIAHEIKNPLNFVNNFSDISGDLVDEIISADTEIERKEILKNLKSNLAKISLHGKRADVIVESMLSHSSKNLEEKQLTDINKLCSDHLHFSFQEMKLVYPEFSCELTTRLDKNIPLIRVIPFDIGRALQNVINNALYAVNEKKLMDKSYESAVTLSTNTNDKFLAVRIADNGNGIPENICDKIFNPFFTTKPAGKGTGLGLSLSYDILAAHGGNLRLESNSPGNTIFIIELPLKS